MAATSVSSDGFSLKMFSSSSDGEAVQAGRQEPPQPHDVRLDVAEVAEEDVPRRDQEGARQGEHELDGRDDRDEQQVWRDAVRIEEHQQPEGG